MTSNQREGGEKKKRVDELGSKWFHVLKNNKTIMVNISIVWDWFVKSSTFFFFSYHLIELIAIDEELRRIVVDILHDAGCRPRNGGVYVQTLGPRFETRAEVCYDIESHFQHFIQYHSIHYHLNVNTL